MAETAVGRLPSEVSPGTVSAEAPSGTAAADRIPLEVSPEALIPSPEEELQKAEQRQKAQDEVAAFHEARRRAIEEQKQRNRERAAARSSGGGGSTASGAAASGGQEAPLVPESFDVSAALASLASRGSGGGSSGGGTPAGKELAGFGGLGAMLGALGASQRQGPGMSAAAAAAAAPAPTPATSSACPGGGGDLASMMSALATSPDGGALIQAGLANPAAAAALFSAATGGGAGAASSSQAAPLASAPSSVPLSVRVREVGSDGARGGAFRRVVLQDASGGGGPLSFAEVERRVATKFSSSRGADGRELGLRRLVTLVRLKDDLELADDEDAALLAEGDELEVKFASQVAAQAGAGSADAEEID